MRKTINGFPLPSTLGTWMSHHDCWSLSSNPAAIVSVDLLPGTGGDGTCTVDCEYCYGKRGRQAYRRAREKQAERSRLYRQSPSLFADFVAQHLARINAHFGLHLGSAAFPLRLFGNGDGVDRRRLELFADTLRDDGVHFFGYSRIDCAVPELALSIDRYSNRDAQTFSSMVCDAIDNDRKIVYVRLSADDVAPKYVKVIFPEHRARKSIPVDPRDCYKLRHVHSVGVCYKCRRCFPKP